MTPVNRNYCHISVIFVPINETVKEKKGLIKTMASSFMKIFRLLFNIYFHNFPALALSLLIADKVPTVKNWIF